MTTPSNECQSCFQERTGETNGTPARRPDPTPAGEFSALLPENCGTESLRREFRIMENEQNLVMEILEDDNYDFETEFSPRRDVGH